MSKLRKVAIGLAAVAGLALTAPAALADGYQGAKGGYKPAYVPVYNWSGIYFGGHIGYGMVDVGRHLVREDNLDVSAITPAYGYDADGWIAGGQIGIQRQFGNLVAGVEVSVSGGDMKGDTTGVNFLGTLYNDCNVAGALCRSTTDIQWLTTVTGRLGFAVNNWLLFVKAGYAGASVNSTLMSTFGGLPERTTWRSGEWHHGWTVGVGFDYQFMPNISLGLEYNYVSLDEAIHSGRYLTNGALFNNWGDRTTIDDIHVVKMRLNFHIGHNHDAPAKPLK